MLVLFPYQIKKVRSFAIDRKQICRGHHSDDTSGYSDFGIVASYQPMNDILRFHIDHEILE